IEPEVMLGMNKMKDEMSEDEVLKGGLADNKSLEDLAKKHEIKIKRHEQIMSSDISNVPSKLPALDGFGPIGHKYRSTREYIIHDSIIERAALLSSVIYKCVEKNESRV
ncbi:MAG: hypothetical protein ACE5RJ_03770, partial [Nitrosopumilaceae archaeon]